MQETQKNYSLEVMGVASDNRLSPAEKAQRIKASHHALPSKVAGIELNGADFSADLEEQIAALRLRKAPDEEVQHLRQHYFGAEEVRPARGKHTGK